MSRENIHKKTTKVMNKKRKKHSDVHELSLINYDAVEKIVAWFVCGFWSVNLKIGPHKYGVCLHTLM